VTLQRAAGGSGAGPAPESGVLSRSIARLERRLREPGVRTVIEVAAPTAIVLLAAIARMTALGHPHMLVFDESYYVKQAWSTWQLGYEGVWQDGANARFEAGDTGALTAEPDFVVHPPLGKWVIGITMAMFGIADPGWWRLPTAVTGVALVLLTYAVARGMLRSVAYASLAAFWMAIDGLAIVMSRTALLDSVLAMFVLAGLGALLLDRRGSPARTVRSLAAAPHRFGAAIWSRPWLVVGGAMLGAAAATKWSGAAFLAVFGVWSAVMDALDRRRSGYRSPWWGTLLSQAPVSFVLVVGPALIIYVASYAGWFGGGWGSQVSSEGVADASIGVSAWLPEGLQRLWNFHAEQLAFHVSYHRDHPQASPASEWLLLGHPTVFLEGDWTIVARPNTVVWFAGLMGIGLLLLQLIRNRDRRAAVIVLGFAAGYAPWLFTERTTYFFYAIVFLPFLTIGLAYALQLLRTARWPEPGAQSVTHVWAPGRTKRLRRGITTVIIAGLVYASIIVALRMLPTWYGIPTGG
jgi:dolichyl-phosphate-mannose-protein mannosyltransferase